nr:LysM peptidoglycan-binding domain-containing protein [Rhodococcus opacus]
MPSDPSTLFHPLILMNVLFATSAWCLARPTRVSAIATVVAAVLWVFGNGPLEGETLYEITRTHGVTVSDLLAVGAVLVATWACWPARSPRVARHSRS